MSCAAEREKAEFREGSGARSKPLPRLVCTRGLADGRRQCGVARGS